MITALAGCEVRDILGLQVTAATAEAVVRALDDAIDASRNGGRGLRLGFVNAHASNLAARDPAFTKALSSFVLLNDGAGLDLASRFLHRAPFPQNLNGTDFVPFYLTRTRHALRLFLLGGQDGVAAAAAEALRKQAPQHEICGVQHGFFPERAQADMAARVRDARADVVLVALGNPAQEMFIARHFEAMDVKLAIGVGALFDFLSGRISRAPALLRRLKLEWLYRLALEPKRLFARYVLGNPRFLWRVMATRRTPRRRI